MTQCPCGSGQSYQACCEPLLAGRHKAQTAEALMRSRYTAFTRVDVDYLERSHHPKTRNSFDRPGAEKWARDAEWQGLDILSTEAGAEQDRKGVVEFKARYRINGEDCVLHEISEFERKQGDWYYVDGQLPQVQQYRREGPKVGRNDPCVCGSGKKYKKCCG